MRDEKSTQCEKSTDLVAEYEEIINGYEILLTDQEKTFVLLLDKHKSSHERLSKELAELKSENDRLRRKIAGKGSSILGLVAWISAVMVLVAWLVVPYFCFTDLTVQNNSMIDTESQFRGENPDIIELDLEDYSDPENEDFADFDNGHSLLTKILSLKLFLTILSILPAMWVILFVYYLQKLRNSFYTVRSKRKW